jgi:hypothetical protein
VTVRGLNFSGTAGQLEVFFGTTEATSVSITSDGVLVATSPAHAPGIVDVTVRTPWGTSAVTASTRFTFTSGGGAVTARRLFYNNSAFDGQNAAISAADDAAIASDKSAYLPGSGLAAFNNVTSYSRGINGIMVDLAGGGSHASINANDFVFKVGNNNSPSTWAAAPAPSAISVRFGAGVSGSDRVEITWATGGITNTWLEVQLLANARTGLASADVFFWGSRVGETTSPASGATFVTNVSGDGAAIVGGSPAAGVGITNTLDINRSNTVNVSGDRGEVVGNSPGSLLRINISAGGPFAPEGSDAGAEKAIGPVTKGVYPLSLASSKEADAAPAARFDPYRGAKRLESPAGLLPPRDARSAYFQELADDRHARRRPTIPVANGETPVSFLLDDALQDELATELARGVT